VSAPPPSRRWERALSLPFILGLRLYQGTLGPLMGGHCRFHPTCSEYAIEAYREHGPIRGTWLTLRRLLRCHPLGGRGYDPVPLRQDRMKGPPGRSRAVAPGVGSRTSCCCEPSGGRS
jgi:putative membrane protein insertion efficiency factor